MSGEDRTSQRAAIVGESGSFPGRPPRRDVDTRFAFVFLFVMSVLLSSCFLTPAVNIGDYRNKAGASAQAMISIIGSATLAAQLQLANRLTETVTNDVVSAAEMDAGSVTTAFDSRQPPDRGSLVLKARTDYPLQHAAADLAALRIAVREGDTATMRQELAAMHALMSKLTRLEQLRS